MQKFYIYKFQNKINNKVYIGQTVHLEARYRNHINDAAANRGRLLARAIKKYGIENFNYCVIEEVETSDQANEKEIYWIEYYKSNIKKYGNDFGYNLGSGGSGDNAGRLCSEEHKIKSALAKQGIKNPQVKLTEEQAKEIIQLFITTNISDRKIGEIFGVNRKTISDIRFGKTWQHLVNDRSKFQKAKNPAIKLSKEQVLEIKNLISQGKTNSEIGKIFGAHRRTITDIRLNKTWKHIK